MSGGGGESLPHPGGAQDGAGAGGASVGAGPARAPAEGTAVVVGRWQLPHKGHERLIAQGLAAAARVIIIVGSAFKARDPDNPFTWQERVQMLEALLSPAERPRVDFLPVRDYYDDLRWNRAVRDGVDKLRAERGGTIVLGSGESGRRNELENFPGWARERIDRGPDIESSSLRDVLFGARDFESALAVLSNFVSQPVLDYLEAWSHLPVCGERRAEHRAVADYRRKWTEPLYCTADAVVRVSDHVLLICRAGDIGQGLWALPGGFVEPNERFYDAAVRELREETHFGVLESSLHMALKETALFDHPARSPRGRLVSVAHYFDFGDMPLPEVLGDDDAGEARWVPLCDLPSYEGQLFEDHFLILDRFLGLLPK